MEKTSETSVNNAMEIYNINEKDLLDQLTNDKNLSKLIVGKKIDKSFFVKNRLINILLK